MFDDPKKSLYDLEQALKETEVEPQEEDWLQEFKDLLGDEAEQPAEPKPEKKVPEAVNMARTVYDDEQMAEKDALYVEKPKRKGAGSLVVLALLELIAIGLVVLWWIKWML